MNILCVPPKTLTPQQRSVITKKGVIVIETDSPEKVKLLNPEATLDSNDWFMAALHALTTKNPIDEQQVFINNLYTRLKAKETIDPEQSTNPSI